MSSKAEATKRYIIQKVAPIFNQKGYVDTSLSDITSITGLTKGAVYGNFKDKHELALEAFNYVLRSSIFPLADQINAAETAKLKMTVIFDYYRKYYEATLKIGGCPILNVGIDTNHQNPALRQRVLKVIDKLINNIEQIIITGQKQKEFKQDIDTRKYAKRIYSMIDRCIFTAMMQKDAEHIREMMDYLDDMTRRELYN